jgi:hypothetical protein
MFDKFTGQKVKLFKKDAAPRQNKGDDQHTQPKLALEGNMHLILTGFK